MMKDVWKRPQNKPIFKNVRLHYLRFQIPTAWGLKLLSCTCQGRGNSKSDDQIGTMTTQHKIAQWNTSASCQSPFVNLGEEFRSFLVKWAEVTIEQVAKNAAKPELIIRPIPSLF